MLDYSFTGFEIGSTVFPISYDPEKGWFSNKPEQVMFLIISDSGIRYELSGSPDQREPNNLFELERETNNLFELEDAAKLECQLRNNKKT